MWLHTLSFLLFLRRFFYTTPVLEHQPDAAICIEHGFDYRSREGLRFRLLEAGPHRGEQHRCDRYLLECGIPQTHLETRHPSFTTAIHTMVHLIDRSSQHWYSQIQGLEKDLKMDLSAINSILQPVCALMNSKKTLSDALSLVVVFIGLMLAEVINSHKPYYHKMLTNEQSQATC